MPPKLDTESFIEKARLVHGDRFDYSKVVYVRSNQKVIIICRIHGEFMQMPAEHLVGKKCAECAPNYKMDTARFIEKAQFKWGDRYDYSQVDFTGGKEKVTIICRIHGPFDQQATSHLQMNGCPRCGFDATAKSKVKDTNHFVAKSELIHGKTYDYSRAVYVTRETPVTIICRKHGEFVQIPHNHYQGKGCPVCNNSVGAERVARRLEYHGIKFVREQRFEQCKNIKQLPFDFYLPDYDALVEHDGRQHFEPVGAFGGEEGFRKTKENDAIKNKFAVDTKKPLLRVKYDADVDKEVDKFLFEIL